MDDAILTRELPASNGNPLRVVATFRGKRYVHVGDTAGNHAEAARCILRLADETEEADALASKWRPGRIAKGYAFVRMPS